MLIRCDKLVCCNKNCIKNQIVAVEVLCHSLYKRNSIAKHRNIF